LPTGHRTTVRTGLPTPTWRKLYGGVQPTKSRTTQVTDGCGMLEAYAEVDKALADLNGNTGAFRLSEDRAHIEGMNQEFASTLIYGNEGTEPEAFTGLSPRFNSQSAENARNIITSAATPDSTDNTSIWLVVWGPNTVHGIYPKGSVAGLQMEDKGQVTIESIDGAGGRMEAYRSHYRWDCGLTVRDWRSSLFRCSGNFSCRCGFRHRCFGAHLYFPLPLLDTTQDKANESSASCATRRFCFPQQMTLPLRWC